MQSVEDGMPKETQSCTNWGIISTFVMIPIFSIGGTRMELG